MLKGISTILGVGLVVLWIAGLGSAEAAGWLTWFDGIAALFAFGIAAYTTPYSSRESKAGLPLALSIGLYVLWVIGLATNAVTWLVWWNFAFACAFLGLAIYCSMAEKRKGAIVHSTTASTSVDREREREREQERERMRRSA